MNINYNELQIEALDIISWSLVEIRSAARSAQLKCVYELADGIHNLPSFIKEPEKCAHELNIAKKAVEVYRAQKNKTEHYREFLDSENDSKS